MKAGIAQLLEDGLSRAEIARRLGISPSTVSRCARRLGYRSGETRTAFDWSAVQAYYDEGRTLAETQARFGFSNGAWDAAVTRGDIVPRRGGRSRGGTTRERVRSLLQEGRSQADIARALGLAKATVCHHVRSLGASGDARFARRYDWDEIERFHDAGNSVRACQQEFGFASKTWHDAVRRRKVVPRPAAAPIADYLVSGRPTSRTHLKARLIAAGLKRDQCEECGVSSWRGRSLSLCLHHVNGVNDDNRLENLQLLCPNCHSQTPNFAGRNARG